MILIPLGAEKPWLVVNYLWRDLSRWDLFTINSIPYVYILFDVMESDTANTVIFLLQLTCWQWKNSCHMSIDLVLLVVQIQTHSSGQV